MNIEQRMETERKVVSHLIQTAQKHGYNLTSVDNGEERIKLSTEQEAMEHVFSVDESHIFFKHPEEPKGHCAFIVLGNDGWDAVCDHSCGPGWDAVMEENAKFSDALADAHQFMDGQPTAADLGFNGSAA